LKNKPNRSQQQNDKGVLHTCTTRTFMFMVKYAMLTSTND